VAGSLALDYKDILAGKNVWLMGRWVAFNNSNLEMYSSGLTLCGDGHISRYGIYADIGHSERSSKTIKYLLIQSKGNP
jgi:hypothetical protein